MRTNFYLPVPLIITLAGCNMVSQVQDGIAMSNEASAGIQTQIGIKPNVGFNYMNGSLASVTVQFAEVPKLGVLEVERASRLAIEKAFKSQPKTLVISYVFESPAK